MNSDRISRLGAACKRYGPGRLPGAERRTLGAGYALAATALAATGTFFLGSALLLGLGTVSGAGWFVNLGQFGFTFGIAAVPLVTISAFLTGYLAWRILPARTPYFGIVAGLLATGFTYLLSTVLLFAVVLVASAGEYYYTFAGAVGTTLAIAIVGTLLTCWLAFPIGAAGGYLYERVRTETRP